MNLKVNLSKIQHSNGNDTYSRHFRCTPWLSAFALSVSQVTAVAALPARRNVIISEIGDLTNVGKLWRMLINKTTFTLTYTLVHIISALVSVRPNRVRFSRLSPFHSLGSSWDATAVVLPWPLLLDVGCWHFARALSLNKKKKNEKRPERSRGKHETHITHTHGCTMKAALWSFWVVGTRTTFAHSVDNLSSFR